MHACAIIDPVTVASMYAEFALREAHGVSPMYEWLTLAISDDEQILALLDTVPAPKRQPNLLLGVVGLLGGPVDDPAAFHDFAVANGRPSNRNCVHGPPRPTRQGGVRC